MMLHALVAVAAARPTWRRPLMARTWWLHARAASGSLDELGVSRPASTTVVVHDQRARGP